MNPSPQAIALINTYVVSLSGAWAGNTDAAIVAAANLANVTNPVAQTTIPTPFTAVGLFSQISVASRTNLKTFTALDALLEDVFNQNIPHCLQWWGILSGVAVITAAEATTLTTAVNATELNPAYQALVSWAEINLGRPLDLNDAMTARFLETGVVG
jgi:hypothetical protein